MAPNRGPSGNPRGITALGRLRGSHCLIAGQRSGCCCSWREQCCSCSGCWSWRFREGSIATDRSRRRTWSEESFLKHFFIREGASSLECRRVSKWCARARDPLPGGSHLVLEAGASANCRSLTPGLDQKMKKSSDRRSSHGNWIEHKRNNNDDRHELPTKLCRFNQFVVGALPHKGQQQRGVG